ncbi:hypothetical protein GIB67_023620 [Kingdonia uniflora]|uniref:HAT C-terminal dimerisation domain-containing protein n=1 Tax=Kingdonia uniflora TaxID=39325 RepID=A0A7J7L4Y9_9MAGN|nr:hypothetical protein GIB67_023620 [Kingdonia uniflora]
MDQEKEIIKKEFENKKVCYMPFWKILDGIWSNILHRPIHATGYCLNPSLFYYDDFAADTEIPFGWINDVDQRSEIPSAKWWSLYGVKCHELQRFTVKILNQTCSGALRYGLQKNLSKELLKIGRNNIEQQRLLDIMFVHHNLRLQDCESNAKEGDGNSEEMIDPMDDWIIDEAVTPQSTVDSVAWMNSNTIDNEEGPSKIQPKKEHSQ